MKSYQLVGLRLIKNLVRKKEKGKIEKHLRLYSGDIGRACLFLDSQQESIIEMGFDLRSRAARAYITRALRRLEDIGFYHPVSKGHVLYLKTVLALKELEETPSELSLMNCHQQLTKRVTVDADGRLTYMNYIKVQLDTSSGMNN